MAEWSASNELERLCRQYWLNQSHYTDSAWRNRPKKKSHNGRYRCEDSNHAPPDYKSEPICSAHADKRRPITIKTKTTTHPKSQCGSKKNKKIFENIFIQSCVLVPYMTRVMWIQTTQRHQSSRRINIQYTGKFQAYSQVSNSHTGSVVETTDNTDRKAMYHAPLFTFLETYLFLRGYVVFNFPCNFPPAKLNSAWTLQRLTLSVFYNLHEWPHHFLTLRLPD